MLRMKWRYSRESLLVMALAICASLLAFGISHSIYQSRPLTTDENSYLFQAQNYLEGRISRPLPPIPPAFQHGMIIMDTDARWLSRYPPVHSIWLMPGVRIGYPYIMSLLGAALGILLMSRIAKRLELSPVFTAASLVISPFYVFMYGSLLSHTSGFLLTAAMLLCYIRWIQDNRAQDAALAGLCWGLLFLNRSYTSLLIAIPFGIDASLTFLSRRNLKTFIGCCSFAGVSAIHIGIYRLYNKMATGSYQIPTYLFYDTSEGLGFGPRHTGGLAIDHTIERGVHNVIENLTIMDQWVWGFTGGLILVAILFAVGWRKRWSPLLLAAPLFVWAGHVAFWYAGLEHFRPVYFFETMVFVCIGAALGFECCFDKLGQYPRWQQALKVLIIALLLVAGLPFVTHQARFFFEHNSEANMVHNLMHTTPSQSLVLLEGLEHKLLGENMLNLKGLASDPLVARSNPIWNDALVSLFPERKAFILDIDTAELHPYTRREPVRFNISASQAHRRTGMNMPTEDGSAIRIALPEHQPGFMLFGRHLYLTKGTWLVRMYYSLQNIAEGCPALLDISSDGGRSILHTESLYGSVTNASTSITITVNDTRAVEPRVFYGGSGTIAISRITVESVVSPSNPK